MKGPLFHMMRPEVKWDDKVTKVICVVAMLLSLLCAAKVKRTRVKSKECVIELSEEDELYLFLANGDDMQTRCTQNEYWLRAMIQDQKEKGARFKSSLDSVRYVQFRERMRLIAHCN